MWAPDGASLLTLVLVWAVLLGALALLAYAEDHQ